MKRNFICSSFVIWSSVGVLKLKITFGAHGAGPGAPLGSCHPSEMFLKYALVSAPAILYGASGIGNLESGIPNRQQ